jgi:predicted SAM-dependent methyltransferase
LRLKRRVPASNFYEDSSAIAATGSSKAKPLQATTSPKEITIIEWAFEATSLTGIDALWYSDDGLPFDGGTCDFIYNEHFLEHLTIEQGRHFLRECCRVLKPGGVLRIAMPDMNECVRQYWENDWEKQPWIVKHGYTWIRTRCEYLNIAFREWEHKWLYDREELRRRLSEAGFSEIIDVKHGDSKFPELRNRESRPEAGLICEASIHRGLS